MKKQTRFYISDFEKFPLADFPPLKYRKEVITITKEELLQMLKKEDLQTLSLAYVYAFNVRQYGVDVTAKIETAAEQSWALERAYQRGFHEALEQKRREI